MVDASPTGDDILDNVLARLAASTDELTSAGAIALVTLNSRKFQERALQRLVAKGVLRQADGRWLWVFHSRRYPVIDDREQREVKTRLRQVLLTDEIPDPRDVVLICLIEACGLLGLVLTPDEIAADPAAGGTTGAARPDRPGGDPGGRRDPVYRQARDVADLLTPYLVRHRAGRGRAFQPRRRLLSSERTLGRAVDALVGRSGKRECRRPPRHGRRVCGRRVGGGLGAIIVVVIGLFLGIDPSTLMALLNGHRARADTTAIRRTTIRDTARHARPTATGRR